MKASSAMKSWSQHSTRSVAPPTAKPWICPITGFGQCQIFMKRSTFLPIHWRSRTGSQAPSRGSGPGAS
jgi:hypothetical protein